MAIKDAFHALLDAARMGPYIDLARELNPQHASLYKGRSEDELANFAPYIYSLSDKQEFIDWLIKTGWGNSWGVFLQSSATARDLFKHFRRFLLIYTEAGEEVYFRFYDPRVLRVFLPTCDANQLHEFFGPVQSFFMEDEDPAFGLHFWLEDNTLQSKRVESTAITLELFSS